MGNKVCYFRGVRLWENLKHWKPSSVRAAPTRKTGLSRKLARSNPRSGNFAYDVAVHTDVKPVTAISGLGRQETFNLAMLQVQAALIGLSDEAGPLSWCQDDAEYLTVSGVTPPGAYPGSGVVSYTGSGFTPAIGDYCLFRNPTTGDGFVAAITAIGTGTVTAILPEAVAAAWEIVLVRFYLPTATYLGISGWDTATQAEDNHAFDVTYTFEVTSHAVYKAAYAIDLT